MFTRFSSRRFVAGTKAVLFSAWLSISIGCSGSGTPPTTVTAGPADDDTIVVNEDQLSSKGSISGTIAETRTTKDAGDSAEAAQTLPLTIDPAAAVVTFEDVEGQPLRDANGEPYPSVSVDQVGAFFANGMPVGIDFVVVVDVDGDGTADIRQFVKIPADESGVEGRLDNVVVDPLTTLVVAKLRQLLEEEGIDVHDLDISPTAIVTRLVDAFTHLFNETGIDRSLTLDDIENLSPANLEELFEALIPPTVRSGFDTVEGSLALERASELEGVIKAAAEVFLKAGFPIADGPEGIDLSFLADLPNVEVKSIAELFQRDESRPDDGAISPESLRLAPVVYLNTVVEPDRNFVGERDFEVEEDDHRLPLLNEHLLRRMAALHLEDRGITLRNLYRLLTDVDLGLGVRLTYSSPQPFFEGPPAMVFETADGGGVEIDLDFLFFSLNFSGLDDPEASPDLIEAQEANLRTLVRELLSRTVPPSFQRLFGAIVSDRLEGVEQLFRFIREGKAHLPFSRSGPATFFVVADGDQFASRDGVSVNPVTVDIVFGDDYMPMSITHNPSHTGEFFLGFTHETDERHIVELLVRETGRPLHGPQGKPLFLSMENGNLFQPVNGTAFIDFVSDSGTFFPGVPVNVPNPDYGVYEPFDQPLSLASADGEEDFGPTMHLFVLATEPGFHGEPVRIDYNIADDTFTYNPNGRYYLMFVEETESQGLFGLYDIDLNFMPTVHDLTADRFIDIPEVIEEPADDPTIIPDDLDLTDADGDGFPAFVDPDDNDANVVPPFDGDIPEIPSFQLVPDEPTDPIGSVDGGDFIPDFTPVLVSPDRVMGLEIRQEFFAFVFGTEVPNRNFDSRGNPYFDDANGNGIEDEGEFTSDWRPLLFDANDWRATDITRYYRRASGGGITMDEVAFDSSTPKTNDGETLVPRRFLPRLNAFRFGRPNSAINLLTTFLPSEFFNGTQAINEDTEVGIFQALAMINLVMEQVLNVEAAVDHDGPGPIPATTELVDAHLFVIPIGDPFALLINGFEKLSRVRSDD